MRDRPRWSGVCMSMCHTRVLYQMAQKISNFFSARQPHHSSFFLTNSALQNSQGNHLSGGIKYAECRKLQFSDNISQYIRNDRKEGRSYYGTLIFNAPAEVALEFCDGGSRKKTRVMPLSDGGKNLRTFVHSFRYINRV